MSELREQIEAAFNSSESEEVTEKEVAEGIEDSSTETESPIETTSETSNQEDLEAEDVPAPEHWAAEDKEVFKSVDKRGKEFLVRRHKEMEADYTKKQQALSEQARVAEHYSNMIKPHQEYLKQINIPPEVAFDRLMAAQRILMTGTDEQKAIIMQNLAREYKVDLNREIDPIQQQNQIMWQELQDLKQRQMQREQQQEQEVQQVYKDKVELFSQEKDAKGNLKYPHFEAVKPDMALLLKAGKAATLEESYFKSIMMDENLRKEHFSKQQHLEDNSKKEVLTKKAGFNVKAGAGGQISDPERQLTTRELLSQAYDAQTRK